MGRWVCFGVCILCVLSERRGELSPAAWPEHGRKTTRVLASILQTRYHNILYASLRLLLFSVGFLFERAMTHHQLGCVCARTRTFITQYKILYGEIEIQRCTNIEYSIKYNTLYVFNVIFVKKKKKIY